MVLDVKYRPYSMMHKTYNYWLKRVMQVFRVMDSHRRQVYGRPIR